MKTFFTATLSLAFAACTLADYNTVVADINTVADFISILDNDTLAVVSGVAGVPFALQVEVDALNLDNAIVTATRDANASPAFGEPGSLTVAASVISLTSKVQKVLQDVTAQKATFGELSPIVLSSLYRESSPSLGNIMISMY